MGMPADDIAAGPPVDRDRFTAAWQGALPSLWAFCRRTMQHRQDAEDLLQHVALRAWRGVGAFRGTSSFQTWVLRIAEHEAARLGARRLRQRRAELLLDTTALDQAAGPTATRTTAGGTTAGGPATAGPTAGGPAAGGTAATRQPAERGMRAAITGAHRAGLLNDAEHAALTGRLDHPDLTWEQLAARLDRTATAAAVAHSRGIPKLRVYLFQAAPDVLGDADEIRTAFALARAARTDRLSPAEALTFQRIVLDGAATHRPRGWQLQLRSACAKVARHLPARDDG